MYSSEDILKESINKNNLYISDDNIVIMNNVTKSVLLYIDKWIRYIYEPSTGKKTYPMLLDMEENLIFEYITIYMTYNHGVSATIEYKLIPIEITLDRNGCRQILFRIL